MPAPRTTSRAFPAFAGVALADILANSVAIVIIMIVVTLLTRYEQEQDKQEQAEDVGVLLSREIAGSFVMNSLPTSAPAQLHDYVASPLDRNPQHAVMPIIELHDGHLRDYYTGRVFPRAELLRADNAFDAYLKGLAPAQLAATRVDVYGIAEFYIAMSIFKAHGLQPRHWHFLGPQAASDHREGAPGWLARAPQGERERQSRPGQGGIWRTGRELGQPGDERALPEDVDVAYLGGFDIHYPHDPFARSEPGLTGSRSASGGTANERMLDLPGGPAGGESPAERRERADRPPAPGPPPAIQGNRFRAAVPATPRTGIALSEDFPMRDILRGLLSYMASLQAGADAGEPSPLPRYDFVRDVVARAKALLPPTPEEERLLASLEFLMETPRRAMSGLDLAPAPTASQRGQSFAAFPNEPLGRVRWLHGPAQRLREAGQDAAAVTLRLGTHAEVHEGLRVQLQPGGVLLAPPAELSADPRWRAVTVVDAERSDFVTGFVYAATDDAGRLVLPVDENAVEVDGARIESRYPSVALRSESWRLLFYGTLGALFAAGVAVRYWPRAA